jgi:hypothetical protein
MVDVAFGAAAITVTAIWVFLGCWLATNINFSTHPVTSGFWLGVFIIWSIVTVFCFKTIIESRVEK